MPIDTLLSNNYALSCSSCLLGERSRRSPAQEWVIVQENKSSCVSDDQRSQWCRILQRREWKIAASLAFITVCLIQNQVCIISWSQLTSNWFRSRDHRPSCGIHFPGDSKHGTNQVCKRQFRMSLTGWKCNPTIHFFNRFSILAHPFLRLTACALTRKSSSVHTLPQSFETVFTPCRRQ